MIDVDFIEIGTSDFDTLIEKATDDTVGFSIEPIKRYLDRLPNKPNVKKVNMAISFDGSDGTVDVYYIDEEKIKAGGYHNDLKGCNCINDYHPKHRSMGLEHLVTIEKVLSTSISKFLIVNEVRGIKLLKIDTEGGDCYILRQLAEYLTNKEEEFFPKQIFFESNKLTDPKMVDETIELYKTLGYRLVNRTSTDTTLAR